MRIASQAERNPAPGCGPCLRGPDPSRALREQVFDSIRAAGQISRARIAKALSVSPASVSGAVFDLLEAGLVREDDSQPALAETRGRPPVALAVNGAAHAVAGLRLSDREHSAVILDLAGRRLGAASRLRSPRRDLPEVLLDDAARVLDAALADAGLSRGALSGLGLGLAGFVETASGRVLWSPLLHHAPVALERLAADRFGLDVAIDNDANLVALAELWFGRGRSRRDFAVVTIEHGVGMGLVLGQQIYHGARGLGLELGHTKVHLDGALCRCGQRGCLEAYVADYALAREAAVALGRTERASPAVPAMLESLYDHAKAGHPAARTIFRRAGRYLALGLANVVNLLDPPLILLSGERMRYDYLYAEDTLAEMVSLTLNTGTPPPPIEIHAWRDLLWAQGAAALALSRLSHRLLGGGHRP